MLGNKLTPPNSRFLGHKYIAQYTLGNKREPKNLSSNLILSQSKYPEIINYGDGLGTCRDQRFCK